MSNSGQRDEDRRRCHTTPWCMIEVLDIGTTVSTRNRFKLSALYSYFLCKICSPLYLHFFFFNGYVNSLSLSVYLSVTLLIFH
jgi:hypothetical protein